jgi:hypothetical protein
MIDHFVGIFIFSESDVAVLGFIAMVSFLDLDIDDLSELFKVFPNIFLTDIGGKLIDENLVVTVEWPD